METEIFKLLASASDIGILALVYMAWKFDKRVTILEVHNKLRSHP